MQGLSTNRVCVDEISVTICITYSLPEAHILHMTSHFIAYEVQVEDFHRQHHNNSRWVVQVLCSLWIDGQVGRSLPLSQYMIVNKLKCLEKIIQIMHEMKMMEKRNNHLSKFISNKQKYGNYDTFK